MELTQESASASVPMITWLHFAEQFPNKKLIVEELRIVSRSKGPMRWATRGYEVLVMRGHIKKLKKPVYRLTDESTER